MISFLRSLIYIIAIFALIISLSSCSQGDESLKKFHENKETNKKTNFALRVAVSAMVSPKNTYSYYNELIAYICSKLGCSYKFIQKKTYKEVNDLLMHNQVDIAFICSGAYKISSQTFDPPIICVPVMYGEPFYQSILITQKSSRFSSIDSLKGASICYTDSFSNSGYMYLNHYLNSIKVNPDTLFRKQIFSGGHDVSIAMVQKGLVDVAPVDKLIYDYLSIQSPDKISNIKIIHYSPKFGAPPVVASKMLEPNLFKSIQNILLTMHEDIVGRNILKKIHIDRFVKGEKRNYENIPIFSR